MTIVNNAMPPRMTSAFISGPVTSSPSTEQQAPAERHCPDREAGCRLGQREQGAAYKRTKYQRAQREVRSIRQLVEDHLPLLRGQV